MKYPVSNAIGYDVNIGKHIFNRTIKNGKLVGAKLMAFYYTSLITDEISRLKLENFGRVVCEMAEKHNKNQTSRVNLLVHGTTAAASEVQRGFMNTMKLTVGCELFLQCFICCFSCFCYVIFVSFSFVIFFVDASKAELQPNVVQFCGTDCSIVGMCEWNWSVMFDWNKNQHTFHNRSNWFISLY